MKTRKRFLLLLLCTSVFAGVSWFTWSSLAISGKVSLQSKINMDNQLPKKSNVSPCWFTTLEDKTIPYEMIAQREAQNRYGYQAEIPLNEAIRKFNEEKGCNQQLSSYLPLTEDEVIAAIVAGPGYGAWGETWRLQKDTLWKIATKKIMPKGSLMVATSGPNVQESPMRPDGTVKAKGISIAILLGLDTNENGVGIKQEQVFEIRRTYFAVETLK
ncbi:MAG: hypothetical protein HOP19_13405 [Acidobacteria bacterium]|nr:hypothetical protein [Acidobacteriota bacterium]